MKQASCAAPFFFDGDGPAPAWGDGDGAAPPLPGSLQLLSCAARGLRVSDHPLLPSIPDHVPFADWFRCVILWYLLLSYGGHGNGAVIMCLSSLLSLHFWGPCLHDHCLRDTILRVRCMWHWFLMSWLGKLWETTLLYAFRGFLFKCHSASLLWFDCVVFFCILQM